MKILFVNSAEWNQLLGRYQMLYYEAAKKHDCTVLDSKKVFRRKSLKYTNPMPEKYRRALIFPYQYESRLSRFLTGLSYKRQLRDINDFDVVIVSGPELFRYIPKSYKNSLVYDCFDLHGRFSKVKGRAEKTYEQERLGSLRSKVVFASAQKLEEHIKELAPEANTVLVRNGISGLSFYEVKKPELKENYKIAFFGGVRFWVDLHILKSTIDDCPNIEYRIIGPIGTKIESHDRIVYEGSCKREELYERVSDCDALIMPFNISELTEAVDPLKMYEYIDFGKCIIASYYDEISRFEPFVYFYHNENEYVELIKKLSSEGFPPKYDGKMQRELLEESTWEKRFEIMDRALSEYCS